MWFFSSAAKASSLISEFITLPQMSHVDCFLFLDRPAVESNMTKDASLPSHAHDIPDNELIACAGSE
jgi:hypothetical protein